MRKKATQINEYAKKIHAQNVERGWWDNPDRCVFECLQLVSTEVAEATEGDRKGLMDDHLPHRKMAEVELADAKIRVLDLAGKLGWKYVSSFAGHSWLGIIRSSAGQHLIINRAIGKLAEKILDEVKVNDMYSGLINTIDEVAELQGYDIDAAMIEKLEYNKTRADHDRENRAKAGGKKY